MTTRERHQWKASIIFGVALGVAIATPHLEVGHWLALPDRLAESLVLFVDFAFAGLFWWLYDRDLKRARSDEETVRARMVDSYRHVGKANVTIEILSRFLGAAREVSERVNCRSVVQDLFRTVVVSVLGSDAGLMRLVDRRSLRTVTEFEYHLLGQAAMRLSNKVVDSDRAQPLPATEALLVSDFPGNDLLCVLLYRKPENPGERKVAYFCLTQLHLLVQVFVGVQLPSATKRGYVVPDDERLFWRM